MRAPLTFINDRPRLLDEHPTAIDGTGTSHPRRFWLGYFAFWTIAGFRLRALLAAN
jgi:hypothetical protein